MVKRDEFNVRLSFRGKGMTSQRTRDRLVRRLEEEGISNTAVLHTMREVPRHIFVDEALASRAYEDTALPIGSGQTISQPYVVARMTEALLAGGPVKKVLEIGTGCGYQTAILANLITKVYSIERIAELLRQARERLHALGLRNVRLRHGDGNDGWLQYAPYDAIIVTAAPAGVPDALVEQLVPDGRIVVPVGGQGTQRLLVITRSEGGIQEYALDYVSFVPMMGGIG